MVQQLQKVIESLGYSPNEAKVYLATLSLGECHVSDIAARCKLPRTSVQLIVDTLHRDGLMNFYVQRRYKYWVAENPERLLANFQKREEAMREALPTLSALRSKSLRTNKKKHSDNAIQLFRMLADSSAQPVLIANEHVEIEYVNAVWERQFGYSLEEVRGENPRILQSGKTPREVYSRMWEALKIGTLFQSEDIVDRRKDGSFFNLLTTIFPLTHEGKRYYIQILADITERKQAKALKHTFAAAMRPTT
jgi:PAS domain S-box-containing protein